MMCSRGWQALPDCQLWARLCQALGPVGTQSHVDFRAVWPSSHGAVKCTAFGVR